MQSRNEKLVVKLPENNSANYGVNGSLTRKEWQDECYKKFLTGVNAFNTWITQLSQQQIPLLRTEPDFSVEIHGLNPDYPDSFTRFGWTDKPCYFVVDFTNRVFNEDANFDNFQFPHGAIFTGATFKKLASFNSTVFHNSAFFQNVRFLDLAIFTHTTFYLNAVFEYSIFKKPAILNYCKFERSLRCQTVDFESDAIFQGSAIKHADFNCSVFVRGLDISGDANSKELQSFGPISFSSADFVGRADFSNRKFNGRTIFGIVKNKRTVFRLAPLFHNCELHQDTTFLEAEFSNNSPDPIAAKAFNTLRNSMSKQQANREEHRFLALELDAERLMTTGMHKHLYGLYRYVSDYGFSVYRPIKWLILIPGVIAGVFYGFIANSDGCIVFIDQACHFDVELPIKTIEFTLLQSLPPLGFDRLTYDLSALYKDQNRLFGFVVIIQKILSLAGWFFVALALRNMFKMK